MAATLKAEGTNATHSTTAGSGSCTATHSGQQHLHVLSRPVSRREAEGMFARQQVAEAFGRLGA